MPNKDERVGQALAALRGDMSQKTLADEMRGRGWKWSQATVWAVEKGERPLRLLEAGDLAEILEVGLEDFFADRVEALREKELQRMLRAASQSRRDLEASAFVMMASRDALRALSNEMEIDEATAGTVQHLIEVDEDQVLKLAQHQYKQSKAHPKDSSFFRVQRIIKEALDGKRY